MKQNNVIIFYILFAWNLLLTIYIVINRENDKRTENMVRNIYNKSTTLTFDQLNEPGSRWGLYGKDME